MPLFALLLGCEAASTKPTDGRLDSRDLGSDSADDTGDREDDSGPSSDTADSGTGGEECFTVVISYDSDSDGSLEFQRTFAYADDATFAQPDWPGWAFSFGPVSASGSGDGLESLPADLAGVGGRLLWLVEHGLHGNTPDERLDLEWDEAERLIRLATDPDRSWLATAEWTWDEQHGVQTGFTFTSDDPEVDPSVGVSEYSWDEQDRMVGQECISPEYGYTYVNGWTYNADDTFATRIFYVQGDRDHAAEYVYRYDGEGRLVGYDQSIAGQLYRSYAYVYDGDLLTESVWVQPDGTSWLYNWSYDDDDRVTSWYVTLVGRDDLLPEGINYGYGTDGLLAWALCDDANADWSGVPCREGEDYRWLWGPDGRVATYQIGESGVLSFDYEDGC